MHTLILSPHVDDEVLGAFSFLGPSTHVLYFGCEARPEIPVEQRLRELFQEGARFLSLAVAPDPSIAARRSQTASAPSAIPARRALTVLG